MNDASPPDGWASEVDDLCDALFNGPADGPAIDVELEASFDPDFEPAFKPAFESASDGGVPALAVVDKPCRAAENRRSETRPMPDSSTQREKTSQPKPVRTLRKVCAATCFLLAGLFLFKGLPSGSFSPPADGPPLRAVGLASYEQPRWVTSNIEDIRVGNWVLADNPEIAGEAQSTQIVPDQWRTLRLRMQKPNGGRLDIVLLRSLDWINATAAGPGKSVYLDLPELGAEGDATVLSIEPCPEIPPAPQDGCRVVTGTFAHSSADVIDVSVDGLSAPIGCTSNHPFWSEDRQAFVQAGQLRPGERLRTAAGTLTHVTRITPRSGTEAVFNLEVDVEHVYYVSTSGVLVHNAYFTKGKFGTRVRTGPKKNWTNDRAIQLTPPTTTYSMRGHGRLPADHLGIGGAIPDGGSLPGLLGATSLAGWVCVSTVRGQGRLACNSRADRLPGLPLSDFRYGRNHLSGNPSAAAALVSCDLACGRPEKRR